jgi:hypothetical protein
LVYHFVEQAIILSKYDQVYEAYCVFQEEILEMHSKTQLIELLLTYFKQEFSFIEIKVFVFLKFLPFLSARQV